VWVLTEAGVGFDRNYDGSKSHEMAQNRIILLKCGFSNRIQIYINIPNEQEQTFCVFEIPIKKNITKEGRITKR